MLSFILPAHNEQDYLPATLTALLDAAEALGEPYEILVVNDDSTDQTAAVAASFGVRVIDVALRQIAAVRNAGARQAVGDILFFLDADTQLPPQTLAAAWRSLQHETVAGGALVSMDRDLPLDARLGVTFWNILSRINRWAAGCFVFVRRDVFEAVGGFSTDYFAAEEIALSVALHRRGPFTILPHAVRTSARKLESHSAAEHFTLMIKTIFTLGRTLRSRDDLHIWYTNQRQPPEEKE